MWGDETVVYVIQYGDGSPSEIEFYTPDPDDRRHIRQGGWLVLKAITVGVAAAPLALSVGLLVAVAVWVVAVAILAGLMVRKHRASGVPFGAPWLFGRHRLQAGSDVVDAIMYPAEIHPTDARWRTAVATAIHVSYVYPDEFDVPAWQMTFERIHMHIVSEQGIEP